MKEQVLEFVKKNKDVLFKIGLTVAGVVAGVALGATLQKASDESELIEAIDQFTSNEQTGASE